MGGREGIDFLNYVVGQGFSRDDFNRPNRGAGFAMVSQYEPPCETWWRIAEVNQARPCQRMLRNQRR